MNENVKKETIINDLTYMLGNYYSKERLLTFILNGMTETERNGFKNHLIKKFRENKDPNIELYKTHISTLGKG